MNGVTRPVSGLTVTMRELLLLPLVRRLWLESDANSRPPWKPLSNAMSIAGPCGWKTVVPTFTVVSSFGFQRETVFVLLLWTTNSYSDEKEMLAAWRGANVCT